MTRRRLIGGSIAIAVAILLGFALTGGSGEDDGAKAASSATGPGTGSGDSGSKSSKKAGAATKKASEVIVQPEGSGKNGLPGLTRKKSAKSVFLVSDPLPKTASSRGKLVAGFPLAIVPLVPGSSVKASGVSSTKSSLQVSLQATSSRSPNAVLTFYRKKLAARDFRESAVPSVGGSTASSFAHGADNLVITVTRSHSKRTTYSVFGTLHTAKSR